MSEFEWLIEELDEPECPDCGNDEFCVTISTFINIDKKGKVISDHPYEIYPHGHHKINCNCCGKVLYDE